MFRQALIASAGAVLVAGALALPAEAKAYEVTLRTDVTKTDVKDTFRLSGEVTGSGAGNKQLIVQRKIGSSGWKTYSTLTTRPTGTFAKTFTMPSPGAKQFRVLVPKSGSLTTGTSNVKTVTGYEWLSLAKRGIEIVSVDYSNNSFYSIGGAGVNVEATVDGHKYPHSIRFQNPYVGDSSDRGVFLLANLAGLCDEASFGYGLDEVSSDEAEDQPFAALGIPSVYVGSEDDYDPYVTPGQDPLASKDHVKVRTPIKSTTNIFEAGWQGREGSAPAVVTLTTPRVHCAASQLPDSKFVDEIATGPTARSKAYRK